ncbi:MAG: site-specific DNA-methyltransferase [Candidatus Omnitrophota bacterium]|nr:site-specific DNA-methyltransferase [Candidatus Omnitrophota bacterium]
MENLDKNDIEFLIDCLEKGKEIPEQYKYALFPTKQKEYELVYAGKKRKEDILADNEEAKAVPLQIEKIFNGKRYPLVLKDWHNFLIFGDNLQILKTFYEDKDNRIKGKIKGRVKLIYIDPPFGTGDVYDGANGHSAYSAKRKGADFVEFLRRRLYLLNELLDEDGSIFVRMDYHFGHYAKIIMDEVFGKGNFLNEIIINRIKKSDSGAKKFNVATDSLFLYVKTEQYKDNFKPYYKRLQNKKENRWHAMDSQGRGSPLNILGKLMHPPTGRHWTFGQESIHKLEKLGRIRLSKTGNPQYLIDSTESILIDSNWTDIPGYSTGTGYPTENSEQLLERVIKSFSKEGDLVMDVFAGSGTTLAVAEKLGRRWVGCDIGKLSIYTIQKRLLEIDKSRDLENQKKVYGKPAKSFAVVSAGLYDLEKVLHQVKDRYIQFVSDLFEVERLENKKIGGVTIDGKKGEFYVQIFPYWEFKDANVDEEYIEDLHKNIGKKIDERFYIIAPANSVDFITDYYEIGDVRYYFLKVPYQIIKELHKVQFKKLRQPQSKNNINDLDDAIGFHFIKQPEVLSKLEVKKDKVNLRIKKFKSQYTEEETGEKLGNFESLAMLLIDLQYNGEMFLMTKYIFADDLTKKNEESEEDVKKELKKQKEIKVEFNRKECGKNIMIIYVDIYGNEFKEILKVK